MCERADTISRDFLTGLGFAVGIALLLWLLLIIAITVYTDPAKTRGSSCPARGATTRACLDTARRS